MKNKTQYQVLLIMRASSFYAWVFKIVFHIEFDSCSAAFSSPNYEKVKCVLQFQKTILHQETIFSCLHPEILGVTK